MWKILKGVWREVRPNAVWDLIKYMAILGISGLSLLGYRYLAYLRDLPSDRVIDAVIFVGSFVLIVSAFALTRYRDAQIFRQATAEPLAEYNALKRTIEENEAKQLKPAPAPPAERIMVNVEPEYLVKIGDGHTAVQHNKLIAVYIGKWLTLSGVVGNVAQRNDYWCVYVEPANRAPKDTYYITSAYFYEQKWVDRIATLRRGDRITLMGRIHSADMSGIQLEDCELVETSPPPKQRRKQAPK